MSPLHLWLYYSLCKRGTWKIDIKYPNMYIVHALEKGAPWNWGSFMQDPLQAMFPLETYSEQILF